MRQNPRDYCCLNCDGRVADHATVFETEAARAAAGSPVGAAFMPLSEAPGLKAAVLGPGGARGGDLEAAAAAGAVAPAEYLARVVAADRRAYETNVGVAPPPRGPGAYVRPR